MRRARRPVQVLTLLATVAVASASLTPTAGAADPAPPLADPLAAGAFCDGAGGANPFSDLGQESATTRAAILCLVATGLTQGTTPSTYEPGLEVTRRQMAVFIQRLADLLDGLDSGTPGLRALPPADGAARYPDVAAGDSGAAAISRLSQAGIVGGFPDGTFRPTAEVSRRQMAAFINRLRAHLTGSPFATTGNYFDDDAGDSGEADLNAVASAGIFQGDGQGRVRPGDSITRRQMANILLRGAQVHLAEGSIEPRFGPDGSSPSTGQAFGIVTAVTGTSSAVLDGDEAVQFHASDTYRVLDTDSGLFGPASRSSFFAELSRDDTLFSCTGSSGQPANYTHGAANELCLIDSAPSGPRGVRPSSPPTSTGVLLMWGASPTAVTSYTVNANDEACASTTIGELAPLTTVPSTELSAQVSGLTSRTTYCFVVTANDVNDASPLAIGTAPQDADNTVELTTQ